MAYRVGFPFWKWSARARLPISLRVDVIRDTEAGVFVATSPDLGGLVAEAATLEALVTNINAGILDLMSDLLDSPSPPAPITNLRISGALGAL